MKLRSISLIIFLLGIMPCIQTSAQIDVEQKSKDAAVNRADQRTDQGIDKGLDAVEDGVKSLFKKKDKKPKEEEITDETKSSEAKESTNETDSKQQPALTSYSKFDFVPGDKVIFYDDFSTDAIGDFPASWNTTGSAEVATTNLIPGKWLKMRQGAYFLPEVTIPFNENFTFECDLIFRDSPTSDNGEAFEISFIDPLNDWKIGDNIANGCMVSLGANVATCFHDGSEFFASSAQPNNIISNGNYDKKTRVSIWVQKQRYRLYLNETKILDLPRLLAPSLKCSKLAFSFFSNSEYNSLITNVRVAIGAPDTRNKLLTTGKLVTYGITFDVNSDKIKSESYGTLKDIATVLTENASVKINIIGHTDGDGDAAKNLDLSKRRAASVKNELSKTFGIDASRITTDGKGKTQPIAPNDTPSNKAQNRRVELIKL